MGSNWGPTPSHDGSFYERYIRRLHSFKINLKPGEQESTFLESAVRQANLRAMMFDADEALSRFSHFLQEHRLQERWDPRGTKLGSLLFVSRTHQTGEGALYLPTDRTSPQLSTVQVRLVDQHLATSAVHGRTSLLSHDVHTLPKFSAGGVAYCTEVESPKDSAIAYRASDGQRAAGVITGILLLQRKGATSTSKPRLVLLVRPYSPLNGDDAGLDEHYRRYANGGFCCRGESGPEQVLDATQVISHIGTTPISLPRGDMLVDVIHCLPLGGVSNALLAGLATNPLDVGEGFLGQPLSEGE